ncbi:MAG: ABC transporter ATP-binding protein [Deltaproteobacteria bacterium]|nr:ABC transporter ATP-binding protein [Deltaproteobacteria bacterium]
MQEPVINVKGLGKEFNLKQAAGFGTGIRNAVQNLFRSHQPPLPHQRKFWAVRNLTFEIEQGESVGIIGMNGSGKSTLLKMLSGVMYPTEGEAKLKGSIGSLLEVGTGFHHEFTGRENIYFAGALLGLHKSETKKYFDDIVAFAELEKFIDIPVKHYSTGMFMRLGFSTSAHLPTSMLFVDEALAVGDTAFQRKCVNRMKYLARQGRTQLFVSHDMNTIQSLCPRSLLLINGTLYESQVTADCIAEYEKIAGITKPVTQWTGHIGNENVELTRFNILSRETANPQNEFQRGDTAVIHLSYQIIHPITDLVIGIEVCDQIGNVLLRSRAGDFEPNPPEMKEPGIYTAAVTIDLGLLYPGEYNIKADMGIHNIVRLVENQAVLELKVKTPQGEQVNHVHSMLQSAAYPPWTWQFSRE